MLNTIKNILTAFRTDESILSDTHERGLVIYYPLSRSTVKQHELYIHQNPPDNRNLFTSLDGLLRWVYADSQRTGIFQYYTIVPISEFKLDVVDGSIVRKKVYDTISVKVPFTVKIRKIYTVPDMNVLEDRDTFNY